MKFIQRLKNIYFKLLKTNDTPHRIALGFAIGIFYGLVPFVGVIFTFLTAIIFRANKATALIGCFVTNTWMTAILLLPSVRVGAKIFGLEWQDIWLDLSRYLKMANIKDIYKAASKDVVIPALVGFFVLAFLIALASYAIILFLVVRYKAKRR